MYNTCNIIHLWYTFYTWKYDIHLPHLLAHMSLIVCTCWYQLWYCDVKCKKDRLQLKSSGTSLTDELPIFSKKDRWGSWFPKLQHGNTTIISPHHRHNNTTATPQQHHNNTTTTPQHPHKVNPWPSDPGQSRLDSSWTGHQKINDHNLYNYIFQWFWSFGAMSKWFFEATSFIFLH